MIRYLWYVYPVVDDLLSTPLGSRFPTGRRRHILLLMIKIDNGDYGVGRFNLLTVIVFQ